MPDIAGLKLIVPTSVAGSGVSVSASGKVTFTAATTISVNGCFTSSYDNYLIVTRLNVSAAVNPFYRLRVSGSDNTTASSYTRQSLGAGSTSVSGARAASNLAALAGAYATQRAGFHWYVYGPALAQPTATRTVMVGDDESANIFETATTHNQSTAYDGFTFLTNDTPTMTGALTIYGLAQ